MLNKTYTNNSKEIIIKYDFKCKISSMCIFQLYPIFHNNKHISFSSRTTIAKLQTVALLCFAIIPEFTNRGGKQKLAVTQEGQGGSWLLNANMSGTQRGCRDNGP